LRDPTDAEYLGLSSCHRVYGQGLKGSRTDGKSDVDTTYDSDWMITSKASPCLSSSSAVTVDRPGFFMMPSNFFPSSANAVANSYSAKLSASLRMMRRRRLVVVVSVLDPIL
jgi:hypothetical protein